MCGRTKKAGLAASIFALAAVMLCHALPVQADNEATGVTARIGTRVTVESAAHDGSSSGFIGENTNESVSGGQTGGAQNDASTRAYVPPDNPVEQAYRAATNQLTTILEAMLARAREVARNTRHVGLGSATTDLIGISVLHPTDAELAKLVNASLIVNNLRSGFGDMSNRYGTLPRWFGNYGLAHSGFEYDPSLADITPEEMETIRAYFGNLLGGNVGVDETLAVFSGPQTVTANPNATPILMLPLNSRLSMLLPGEVTWNMIRPDLCAGGLRQHSYPYGAYTSLGAYLPDGYILPSLSRPTLPSGIDASGWGLVGFPIPGGSGGRTDGNPTGSPDSGNIIGNVPSGNGGGNPGSGGSVRPTPGTSGNASDSSGHAADGTSGVASAESGSGGDIGGALPSGTATAITNTANFVYVQDYRLASCGEITRTNTVYESDVRYWTVYDADGNLLAEHRTEEPRLIFVSYEPGDYIIEAYRQANYETQRLVYYRDLEYLIDANTAQLLNFHESEERPVNVHTTVQHELVPTGEQFRIHVLEDGTVNIENNRRGGIERVE